MSNTIQRAIVSEIIKRRMCVTSICDASGIPQERLAQFTSSGQGLSADELSRVLDAVKLRIVGQQEDKPSPRNPSGRSSGLSRRENYLPSKSVITMRQRWKCTRRLPDPGGIKSVSTLTWGPSGYAGTQSSGACIRIRRTENGFIVLFSLKQVGGVHRTKSEAKAAAERYAVLNPANISRTQFGDFIWKSSLGSGVWWPCGSTETYCHRGYNSGSNWQLYVKGEMRGEFRTIKSLCGVVGVRSK